RLRDALVKRDAEHAHVGDAEIRADVLENVGTWRHSLRVLHLQGTAAVRQLPAVRTHRACGGGHSQKVSALHIRSSPYASRAFRFTSQPSPGRFIRAAKPFSATSLFPEVSSARMAASRSAAGAGTSTA